MTSEPTNATLGLTRPSSVGPSLLYSAMAVFLLSAPTVITSSAPPGVPMVPGAAEFPAAMSMLMPARTISLA